MTFDRRKFVQTIGGSAALAATGIRPALRPGRRVPVEMGEQHSCYAPQHVAVREAAEKIKAETKGRVDIQVFPNNQLGGDTDMLSQVRSGAIDFFPLSGLILQTLVPLAGINGVAFAFKDYATVWAAMDGDLGAFVREADRQGRSLHVRQVPRQRLSPDHQQHQADQHARRPQGLQDPRSRSSPLWTSLFKALGASPTSINFSEVYSALQTKVVEGQENALSMLQIAKLYEVQKYCSMTDHMWDGQWVLANGKCGRACPKDLQAIVDEERNGGGPEAARGHGEAERSTSKPTLKPKGMVFNYPDKAAFRAVLTKAGFYEEWKGKFGAEAWAKLEKYSGKLA